MGTCREDGRVSTSWSKDVVTARAAKDGLWEVRVRPKPSFTPLTITFYDGEQTTIKGVLSGEVWVCAGQSNMEMPVHGFDGCPVEGYNDAVIDAANFSGVRYAKIPSRMSISPEQDADTRWTVVSPSTVRGASATGYFFGCSAGAKALRRAVGWIEANKGGTRVESWLSQENLKANTDEKLDKQSIDAIKTDYYILWYGAMTTLSPIVNTPSRASSIIRDAPMWVITWMIMHAVGTARHPMEKGFRTSGDIPFYFVEIAPYWYDDADGTNAAVLREQQYKASKLIKNCGFIGNNDGAYAWEMSRSIPRRNVRWASALPIVPSPTRTA